MGSPRMVSDRSRPWYPALGAFRPDAPSALGLALFCRRARMTMGLQRAEAEIAYYHCCGYVGNKVIAQLRGVATPTVKNIKSYIFERLGLNGNYQTPQLVVRCWSIYCETRLAAGRIQGMDDAVVAGGLAGGAAGAGAAVLGDVGADGALWAAGVPASDGRMGGGSAQEEGG